MQPRFFKPTRLRELSGKSFAKNQDIINWLDWQAKLLITAYENSSKENRLNDIPFINELSSFARLGSPVARKFLIACYHNREDSSFEKSICIMSCLQELAKREYSPDLTLVMCDIALTHTRDAREGEGDTFIIRKAISDLKRAAFDHTPENVIAAQKLAFLFLPAQDISNSIQRPLCDVYHKEVIVQNFTFLPSNPESFLAMLEDYAYSGCLPAIDQLISLHSRGILKNVSEDIERVNKWIVLKEKTTVGNAVLASEYLMNAIKATLKYSSSIKENGIQYPIHFLIKYYMIFTKMDAVGKKEFLLQIKELVIAYAKDGYAYSQHLLAGWYKNGRNDYEIDNDREISHLWQDRAIANGICSDLSRDKNVVAKYIISLYLNIADPYGLELLQLAYENGSRYAALHLAKRAVSEECDYELANKYIQSVSHLEFSGELKGLLYKTATSYGLSEQSDKNRSYSIRWLAIAISKGHYLSLIISIMPRLVTLSENALANKWENFSNKCKGVTYPEVFQEEMNELVNETIVVFVENKNRLINSLRR